jgi:hypothetical protein
MERLELDVRGQNGVELGQSAGQTVAGDRDALSMACGIIEHAGLPSMAPVSKIPAARVPSETSAIMAIDYITRELSDSGSRRTQA